jgi:hypothetical protein
MLGERFREDIGGAIGGGVVVATSGLTHSGLGLGLTQWEGVCPLEEEERE